MYGLYVKILCRATNIDNGFWNSQAPFVYYLKPWAVTHPCYTPSLASLNRKDELGEAPSCCHSLSHALLLSLTTDILCITTDYVMFSTVIFWFKNIVCNLFFFHLPNVLILRFSHLVHIVFHSFSYSVQIMFNPFGCCCGH